MNPGEGERTECTTTAHFLAAIKKISVFRSTYKTHTRESHKRVNFYFFFSHLSRCCLIVIKHKEERGEKAGRRWQATEETEKEAKAGVTQFDLRKKKEWTEDDDEKRQKTETNCWSLFYCLQGKWRKFSCQIFPFKRIYTVGAIIQISILLNGIKLASSSSLCENDGSFLFFFGWLTAIFSRNFLFFFSSTQLMCVNTK